MKHCAYMLYALKDEEIHSLQNCLDSCWTCLQPQRSSAVDLEMKTNTQMGGDSNSIGTIRLLSDQ